jgi:hypothetical protein
MPPTVLSRLIHELFDLAQWMAKGGNFFDAYLIASNS